MVHASAVSVYHMTRCAVLEDKRQVRPTQNWPKLGRTKEMGAKGYYQACAQDEIEFVEGKGTFDVLIIKREDN